MKILNKLWLPVILGIVSACGEIDANSKPQLSQLSKFNGVWVLSGQTDTASPDEVGDCGYGIGGGNLKISGITVEGEFTDNSGFSYVLEGTIDSFGKMSGAFTYAGYDAATFEGNVSVADGSGTWKDIYDCPGTWQVKREETGLDQL